MPVQKIPKAIYLTGLYRTVSLFLFCCVLTRLNVAAQQGMPIDTNWNQLATILKRIQAPVFPDRDINIVNIGAPTNGVSLSTSFIKKAIDSCSSLGGGRVIIPTGTFVTGAITMKSNVNLYISPGAILKFSTNTNNYLPVVFTRFEGVECYNYSPFIYSYGAENIAVTGSGTLDGQASNSNWWAWKTTGTADVTSLNAMGENGTPVNQRIFGGGHKIRPVFIQFYNSKNILIDSVTIINSPMWEINPVLSQNITISNIHVNSYGPNNDGCDPECSKDVLIYNCYFNTGDDCIAIKSGRNNDGRRVNVPSENIVIQKCTMQDGHGGVTMGSECSGNIRNVFTEGCNMSSPNLDIALRIKTNSVRGGIIENIFMRNCTVGQVSGAVIDINMNYQEGDIGNFTPVVRNIEMKNISCNKSLMVFNLNSYARSPATDIKVIDCNFTNATSTGTLKNIQRLQVYNSFINGNAPLIPFPANGYREAEAYSDKSEWGWSNVLQGFNGNAYMETANINNYIEWGLSVSQDETDTLSIRYANSDTINKPCNLWVNNINTGQFLFPPTQTGWSFAKKNIPLHSGINTIRLVSVNNSVYIDRISWRTGNPALCPGDNIFFSDTRQGNYQYQWQVDTGDGYTGLADNNIYSGTNSDTLHLVSPPTSWSGNKYRCMAISSNDTTYSTEFIVRFTMNWVGTVSKAWENPANWSCGQIPDVNTDVIIDPGTVNYPEINNTTSCRSIRIVYPATVNIKAGVGFTLSGKPE